MPFGIVNKITFIVSCTVLRIRSSGEGRFRIFHSTFEFDTLSDSLIMLSSYSYQSQLISYRNTDKALIV